MTIATNMAGRGTDIKLGEGVAELGGLKIIGTERHESRRIDNQLRGRAGRQGDPGESKFYISLEDDLMRLFGSERMMSIFNSLGFPEGEAIEHKMLSKAVENAQKKIESNNFGIRKNLLDYDAVMNEQREIIYEERRQVLDGENMRSLVMKMAKDTIKNLLSHAINASEDPTEWDMKEVNQALHPVFGIEPLSEDGQDYKGYTFDKLVDEIDEKVEAAYTAKEAEFPDPENLRELERVVLLKVIDRKWMDHIDDMDQLRQGIGLQAYGQKDPKVEYKFAAYDMFDELIANISRDTVAMLMHVRIEQKAEREEVAKVTGTNKDDSVGRAPIQRKEAKVYPNDPCPCGSGKKYKQCCGRKA